MNHIRSLAFLLAILCTAQPARAQWLVFDPANFAEAVTIAQRTWQEYQTLVAQYDTIVKMSKGLGQLGQYRLPSIGITSHDVQRWPYGSAWLTGLNSGDPTGAAYMSAARALQAPAALLQNLPAPARRAIENTYATVEIADSIAQLGGQQVALTRAYAADLDRAIAALEGDVMSSVAGTHEMTAVLDKVAAGALIGRRQDMAANQLLSHALEQLLVRGKRQRDTEAATMNMRLGYYRDGHIAEQAVLNGAASDLRTWRQP